MLGIFPMDITNEVDHPSDLNLFNWKYLQLYDDHLSVVSSEEQFEMQPSDPIPFIDTSDFLNSYKLENLLMPCKNSLCTVAQWRKMWDQMFPLGPMFEIHPKVLRELGPAADYQCLMLIHDILSPQTFQYACHPNQIILFYMKISIEEAHNQLESVQLI